eukprot:TRINITY_DN15181_c0_g1_i1.p1 TRINITY_DN15181_c0_g1~~TRINITY_DN15181_c0_g1_i1.p1  ORF type:complete len:469 (+),score=61.65 TRINITY_DN15181_c0_g1_i1:227-1633(+)
MFRYALSKLILQKRPYCTFLNGKHDLDLQDIKNSVKSSNVVKPKPPSKPPRRPPPSQRAVKAADTDITCPKEEHLEIFKKQFWHLSQGRHHNRDKDNAYHTREIIRFIERTASVDPTLMSIELIESAVMVLLRLRRLQKAYSVLQYLPFKNGKRTAFRCLIFIGEYYVRIRKLEHADVIISVVKKSFQAAQNPHLIRLQMMRYSGSSYELTLSSFIQLRPTTSDVARLVSAAETFEDGLNAFSYLKKMNARPDDYTLCALIKSAWGQWDSTGMEDKIRAIHNDYEEQICPDSYAALMKMHLIAEDYLSVMRLCSEYSTKKHPLKESVVYVVLLALGGIMDTPGLQRVYGKSVLELAEVAHETFRYLCQMKEGSVTPRTWSSISAIYARVGQYERSRELCSLASRYSVEVTPKFQENLIMAHNAAGVPPSNEVLMCLDYRNRRKERQFWDTDPAELRWRLEKLIFNETE